ncbi:ATP-binding protein [uncultured Pseudoflavonifractor sp.]|uniref:ATP-binding protein n=1 Tax=uncultured Pseudoflavonifractor sp. TaxID=1221379 RepID=UPI0025FE6A03|nr:ATP-binding protein [uncultured Pseudoflavonifractor sp.]
MREVLVQVLMAADLPMELLAAAVLFCLPLRRRRWFPFRAAAGIVLCLLCFWPLMYLMGRLFPSLQETTLPLVLVYSFLSFGLAVAFALLCCDISPWEAVYCATCAYLTQHFTYCLYRLFHLEWEITQPREHTLLAVLLYVAVYAGAYFLFARQLAREGRYNTKVTHSLGTMVSALSIALVLSAVAQQLEEAGGPLYPVCLLYAMFCCFYVLWGQVGQQKRLSLQHELDVQQQLWHKSREQYQLSAENVDLINRKCHDLKHQIAALRRISDRREREESIQALEQSVMIYDSVVKTGNDILDTVLTEKSLLCESRGITLTCVADGDCLDFMDGVDIYTIFGNALDNAIESVTPLDDPEKRTIAVSVFSRAGLVLFQMENYYQGALNFDGELPVTRKADRGYHGFGLKSIRSTAEKYGGFLTIQAEDGIFLLRVTIPREAS